MPETVRDFLREYDFALCRAVTEGSNKEALKEKVIALPRSRAKPSLSLARSLSFSRTLISLDSVREFCVRGQPNRKNSGWAWLRWTEQPTSKFAYSDRAGLMGVSAHPRKTCEAACQTANRCGRGSYGYKGLEVIDFNRYNTEAQSIAPPHPRGHDWMPML
eukprot:4531091-Amphidinium_carterae.1